MTSKGLVAQRFYSPDITNIVPHMQQLNREEKFCSCLVLNPVYYKFTVWSKDTFK